MKDLFEMIDDWKFKYYRILEDRKPGLLFIIIGLLFAIIGIVLSVKLWNSGM